MAEMLPHVWDTRGGFLSFTSITDISTALMRPRRPKQYCLQLYIYIYIYIYLLNGKHRHNRYLSKKEKVEDIMISFSNKKDDNGSFTS